MPPPHHPRVAVVIVNWNGKADTVKCLQSLRASRYPGTEIYLVDNDSSDDSVEYFRREFPEARLMVNDRNLGFAGGNNVALRLALQEGADYLFLLNNDAVVGPGTIEVLVESGRQRPGAGILGPKILIMERPDDIYVAGVMINYWKGWTRELGAGEKDLGQYNQAYRCDAVSGCAFFIRRRVIEKVGLLDEEFFAYFEEIDWCARASRAGFEIWYEPSAGVWHKGHGSNAGLARYFLLARNRLLFMRRNARWYHGLFFWPYYIGWNFPKNLLALLLFGDLARAKALVQSVVWNLGFLRLNTPLAKITGAQSR